MEDKSEEEVPREPAAQRSANNERIGLTAGDEIEGNQVYFCVVEDTFPDMSDGFLKDAQRRSSSLGQIIQHLEAKKPRRRKEYFPGRVTAGVRNYRLDDNGLLWMVREKRGEYKRALPEELQGAMIEVLHGCTHEDISEMLDALDHLGYDWSLSRVDIPSYVLSCKCCVRGTWGIPISIRGDVNKRINELEQDYHQAKERAVKGWRPWLQILRYRRRNLQEELLDEVYEDLRWWLGGDNVTSEIGQPVDGNSMCPEGTALGLSPSQGYFEEKLNSEGGLASQLQNADLLTQDIMHGLPAGGSPSKDSNSKALSTADTSQVDQPGPE
jgi:hypothetical protein